MRRFVELIEILDVSTATNDKINAIAKYFKETPQEDAAWALFFLSGHRFKRLVSSIKLQLWCQQEAQIPDWLFVESYAHVGDTAELIALLIHQDRHVEERRSLSKWINELILPLRSMDEAQQQKVIVEAWRGQSAFERFIMNKILTGSFRIGVSSLLTIKGLSKAFSVPESTLSIKLAGEWTPTKEFFAYLITNDIETSEISERQFIRPYPFFWPRTLKEI